MFNMDASSLSMIGEYGGKATWGVAIDFTNSKLFWGFKESNSDPDGKFIRSNLDGSSVEDWVVGVSPHAITVAWVKL